MKTVTLSTLVADTGETPRTLNSWSDFGILLAERSTERRGRGHRRRYRAEPMYGERKWALLASALSKLRLPLAEIKHLIYSMRLMYDPADQVRQYADPSHLEFHARRATMLDPTLRDQTGPPFLLHPWFEDALAGKPHVLAILVQRRDKPFVVTFLHYGDDDPKSADSNMLHLNTVMSYGPTALVLNLSKIFEPLYSNREPVDAE
jgi:hypothetical protein